jgi:glutamine synthetase
MLSMARTGIYPAAVAYAGELGASIGAVISAGVPEKARATMGAKLDALLSLADEFSAKTDALQAALDKALAAHGTLPEAKAFRAHVVPAMEALRAAGDRLETVVSDEFWPYPTYEDMLFKV